MPALNLSKVPNALTAIGAVARPDRLVVYLHDAQNNEITVTITYAESLNITVTGPLTTVQKNELITALVSLFRAP